MIHHVVEPAESFFAAGGDYVGGVWGSFGLFFVALFCSYEHGATVRWMRRTVVACMMKCSIVHHGDTV